MIVVADSSPLITLARAQHFELLHGFYGEVIVTREVFDEVTVAGAGRSGAEEVRSANWIRVQPSPFESSELKVACAGLGDGERSVIYLALALRADLVLIDEARARRVAKNLGLSIAGSIAVLERGAKLNRVTDIRAVYVSLLQQGIRYNHRVLDQSLERLGIPKLEL